MSKKKSLKLLGRRLVLFVVALPAMWLTSSLAAVGATILTQIYYRYVGHTTSNNMLMVGEDFVTDTR